MLVTLKQDAKRRRDPSLRKAIKSTIMTKVQRRVCCMQSPNHISRCTIQTHVAWKQYWRLPRILNLI